MFTKPETVTAQVTSTLSTQLAPSSLYGFPCVSDIYEDPHNVIVGETLSIYEIVATEVPPFQALSTKLKVNVPFSVNV